MNEEQKADLENIRHLSDQYLTGKYEKGALEHGDLLTMSTREYLLNALDENTDQRVYLLKALESIGKNT